MYALHSSRDISSSFFLIRSWANFCHGYIASRILHFFWYVFCVSALAVFPGAPFGRLAICDCQVVCWSALFICWGATSGRAESFTCLARLTTCLSFFFSLALKLVRSQWLFKGNPFSFLRTLASFCWSLLFVVCCTAHPESMTFRRQPFSPFFERRLLFLYPFLFVVCCSADLESMPLVFFWYAVSLGS